MVHKIRYEMRLVLCDYVVRRYDTFNECNSGSITQQQKKEACESVTVKLLP